MDQTENFQTASNPTAPPFLLLDTFRFRNYQTARAAALSAVKELVEVVVNALQRRNSGSKVTVGTLLRQAFSAQTFQRIYGSDPTGLFPEGSFNEEHLDKLDMYFEIPGGQLRLVAGVTDHSRGAEDRKPPQIRLALFRDSPQMDFAAGSALSRHKADPGREVTAGFEDLGVNNGGGDRCCRNPNSAR